jgi:protein gp37
MNAQAKYGPQETLLSRGIEWTHCFGVGSGYTANPVKGCDHDCHWEMPDGKIVECYAQAFRDRIDGKGAFKNITFHPEVFAAVSKHKQRAGIFFDSMSDMLGNKVEASWIQACIDCMKANERHAFFILTKNPRRLPDFDWPDNALVGLSSPPTFMYGKKLSKEQQQAWFAKGLAWLHNASAKWKWVSLEPLAADIRAQLFDYVTALDWAVIGAGSDGRKNYQPNEQLFHDIVGMLTVPIFFKGNLDRALAERHGGWREEFPKLL